MEHIKIDELFKQVIEYFEGDTKRIQHFIKVYTFATLIGRLEKLSENELYILEAAAIVHDIGIKNAEKNTAAARENSRKKKALRLPENYLQNCNLTKVMLTEFAFLLVTTTPIKI
jgi:uncharacterized protein